VIPKRAQSHAGRNQTPQSSARQFSVTSCQFKGKLVSFSEALFELVTDNLTLSQLSDFRT